MRIKVYSKSITPRLQYTLDVVLKQLLGLDFQVISDFDLFKQDSSPKINYGLKRTSPSEVSIPAHSLLYESDIKEQEITIGKYLDLPVFFCFNLEESDFPFDLFAMTFYSISRYEEYLNFEKDSFGRFSAKGSLAYKNEFLHLPLVNLWAQKLGKLLLLKYPTLTISPKKYSFFPTYDIDHAWAYLHKGLLRTVGSSIKDIIRIDLRNLKNRALILANSKKDPYFTFNYLGDLRRKYNLKPIYFFLLANWGKYDMNNSLKSKSLENLIREISNNYSVGIHPSYRSNIDTHLIQIEKERLEKITGQPISKSRQHFLILKFPETYRQLIKSGIREDYTMGYASEIGFRASIANSFYWYDLENESPTNLLIHPFQVMDVTLNQYLKLNPEDVFEAVSPIIENCKLVGGTFTTLWHNSSLTEEKNWSGWRVVYEQIIKTAL